MNYQNQQGQQPDFTNRGVLYKNSQPNSDKSPAIKGPLNVRGEEFHMSGWVKTNRDGTPQLDEYGNTIMQIRVTPKSELQGQQGGGQQQPQQFHQPQQQVQQGYAPQQQAVPPQQGQNAPMPQDGQNHGAPFDQGGDSIPF